METSSDIAYNKLFSAYFPKLSRLLMKSAYGLYENISTLLSFVIGITYITSVFAINSL
jgi:hypothetical protein